MKTLFDFVPTPPFIHVSIPLRVAACKLKHGGYGSCKKEEKDLAVEGKEV
jgi:hypothetical protein